MSDPRMQRLARLVVNYSISVKPKEKVIIDCTFDSIPMAKALVKEIYAAGGHPFVNYTDDALTSELMAGTDREHLENIMKYDAWKTQDGRFA
jgi:aminopeptidase